MDELVKCKVCEKKHKKRGCGYKCKYCGMMGSHKDKNCWKQFPHLKKRGREGERSRSRSHSRGRQKFRNDRSTERKSANRVGEKEKSDYRSSEYRSDNYRQENNRDRGEGYGEYYESYRTKEERRSRAPSPNAGGSRETQTTRRVRPKLDFLDSQEDSGEGFHNLRSPSQLAR